MHSFHHRSQQSEQIRKIARTLGFDQCGISKAEKLDEDARRLEQWLNNGYQGSMQYMERNFDLRVDPTLLVPGARSVITLLYNYFPATPESNTDLRISKYAYGQDYHTVIRNKLKEFLNILHDEIGEVVGRGFVDSAPVLERSWAKRSGLGWIGKNGNLINKRQGSFLFIATLITDLELEPDPPVTTDHCGTCTRCLDACPTQAILPGPTIDGSKCISYFTIELKENIPTEFKGQFNDWMFGCDVCQDVCPWNRFSTARTESRFTPSENLLAMQNKDWKELTELTFKELFKNSAVKRTKFTGLTRNIDFLSKS